jgi:hypothetical protein
MKLLDYASGVINAGLGRQTEGFTDMTSILGSLQALYSSLPILLIFHLSTMIFYGMGAARLSYCYQMNTNPTSNLFYWYVVLAFIFSPVYYPVYGIFLNPLCYTVKR